MAITGPIHTEEYDPLEFSASIEILHKAWQKPFATKSNFAREYASEVAMLASDGMITTKLGPHCFCRKWMITPKGLHYLTCFQRMEFPADDYDG